MLSFFLTQPKAAYIVLHRVLFDIYSDQWTLVFQYFQTCLVLNIFLFLKKKTGINGAEAMVLGSLLRLKSVGKGLQFADECWYLLFF